MLLPSWIGLLTPANTEAEENAVNSADADKVFTGSIPTLYETYLVPLIFQPYAADLVGRVASRSVSRVLELPLARVLSLAILQPCYRKASSLSPPI
jgi:hypothetical protein